MDQRNGDRRGDAAKQSEPDAAGEGRHRRRAEGADQDLAFEADVDDARALRPQAREAGQDQRRAEPDAGSEDDDERIEEVHRASPRQIGGEVVRRASSTATGRRNMCSSAPANSTTRPWMTTIMSRLIFGFSNASSAPPW